VTGIGTDPTATATGRSEPGRGQGAARPSLVLDAGHGGMERGEHRLGRITEAEWALSVIFLLADRCRAAGAQVALTREGDEFTPLALRHARARRHNPDIVLSLHLGRALHGTAGTAAALETGLPLWRWWLGLRLARHLEGALAGLGSVRPGPRRLGLSGGACRGVCAGWRGVALLLIAHPPGDERALAAAMDPAVWADGLADGIADYCRLLGRPLNGIPTRAGLGGAAPARQPFASSPAARTDGETIRTAQAPEPTAPMAPDRGDTARQPGAEAAARGGEERRGEAPPVHAGAEAAARGGEEGRGAAPPVHAGAEAAARGGEEGRGAAPPVHAGAEAAAPSPVGGGADTAEAGTGAAADPEPPAVAALSHARVGTPVDGTAPPRPPAEGVGEPEGDALPTQTGAIRAAAGPADLETETAPPSGREPGAVPGGAPEGTPVSEAPTPPPSPADTRMPEDRAETAPVEAAAAVVEATDAGTEATMPVYREAAQDLVTATPGAVARQAPPSPEGAGESAGEAGATPVEPVPAVPGPEDTAGTGVPTPAEPEPAAAVADDLPLTPGDVPTRTPPPPEGAGGPGGGAVATPRPAIAEGAGTGVPTPVEPEPAVAVAHDLSMTPGIAGTGTPPPPEGAPEPAGVGAGAAPYAPPGEGVRPAADAEPAMAAASVPKEEPGGGGLIRGAREGGGKGVSAMATSGYTRVTLANRSRPRISHPEALPTVQTAAETAGAGGAGSHTWHLHEWYRPFIGPGAFLVTIPDGSAPVQVHDWAPPLPPAQPQTELGPVTRISLAIRRRCASC